MAKLTNIVTRSALLMSVLLLSTFNSAWADPYNVESGATCTYGSDTTADTVILNDNSTIILSGTVPENIVVHGNTYIKTDFDAGTSLRISGDGNVTYQGGFLVSYDSIVYTGTTTVKSGAVTVGTIYATDDNGNYIKDENNNLIPLEVSTVYDLTSIAFDSEDMFRFRGIGTAPGSDFNIFIRNGSFFEGMVDVSGVLTIAKDVDYKDNAALKLCYEAGDAISAENVFLSSGRLDVQGLIRSSLEIGAEGIFSPGNSPGTATVSKAVTLNGELLFEQDELGMDLLVADSIAVPGDENSNPTIKFDFGAEVPEGATYEIIRTTQTLPWNDVQALMADVNIEGLPSNATLSIEGNSVKVTLARDANAVPEPSTWALLVLGTAGLLYLRKREKK